MDPNCNVHDCLRVATEDPAHGTFTRCLWHGSIATMRRRRDREAQQRKLEERCSAKVSDSTGWHRHRCSRKAVVDLNAEGKPTKCKQHGDAAIAERKLVYREKCKAEQVEFDCVRDATRARRDLVIAVEELLCETDKIFPTVRLGINWKARLRKLVATARR